MFIAKRDCWIQKHYYRKGDKWVGEGNPPHHFYDPDEKLPKEPEEVVEEPTLKELIAQAEAVGADLMGARTKPVIKERIEQAKMDKEE